ncbi:MAG: response regulator, partial [Gammaproteobacteria bacterium]|nr:response regulator [Gammaproteobacteria bacterium]NIT63447.1 response regulator [Gammaproteobacteria bacterium]NIV20379.1 response regulator [Gammaproteobacteria bacterium]NIY32027.1 response regulator [Gammaproteobacteria bacterium]
MAGRLLIIDDDVDFAESIADLLEGQGYETALAHSAREGLERIAAADFDLVLLDMKMPGMSGVACLEELHRLRPGLPALMVTAFTRTELLRQALAAGAVAVLGKPVSVDDLFSVVSTVTAPASVLLVEDDQDLAAELCEALAGRGYEVRCAGTLAEARATLSARPAKLL